MRNAWAKRRIWERMTAGGPSFQKTTSARDDFFLNRKLGGENGLDQGVIESTARLEPLDLGGAGRSDDKHLVLAEIESLFKEERNIRDEQLRAPCSSLFQGIKTFLFDPRMKDRLQTGAAPPHRQTPCRAGNGGRSAPRRPAPASPNASAMIGRHLRIRLQQSVHRRIAVENHDRWQQLAQQPANRRFPGSNPTRQRHHSHEWKHRRIAHRIKKEDGRRISPPPAFDS